MKTRYKFLIISICAFFMPILTKTAKKYYIEFILVDLY